MFQKIYVLGLFCVILFLTMAFSDVAVKEISAQENQTLQSDAFDGEELQSFWEVQNGDQSSYELKDGKLVVQGSFNQNIWRDDTTTGFYQTTDQQKFSVETSLIFDHRDLCSEAGLIIKSPSQNEWVTLKLWGHGVDHGWIMKPNSVYLQLLHRGREIVRIVPGYNPPAGNVPVALRLDRDGDNYKTWYKPDAQGEWMHVADTTVSLQGPVQVGIYTAICQAEAPGHLTVSFDNLVINTDPMSTVVADIPAEENQTLQSDAFDAQELQSFWKVQNGDKSPYELSDGKLVVQGSFNQNIFRDDTSTRFYQVTDQSKFSVETSLIIDHKDLCSVVGLIIKSPSQNEWVLLKLWGHGTAHSFVRNRNTVYLQFQHRGREIVQFVPGYNPPAGNVPVALRLDRDGDNYKAWYKPDAQGEWVHIGDTTISLQGPVEVGIYTGICQPEAEGHLTVSFDSFIVSSENVPSDNQDVSTDETKTIRIIGGRSTDYTDSQGRVWSGAAQTNQDWGGWVETRPWVTQFRHLTNAAQSKAIAAGYDPELFYGVSFTDYPNPLKYQFKTGNGTFDVTYLVGEHWSPRNRGFDIIMEGETVEPLYVTPASHEIDIKVYKGIEVKDGILDITFHGNSATGVGDLNPMFSALEIIPSSSEMPSTMVEPEEIEQVLTSNSDPSLILYFSFDELNGNQTIDHSTHQNHGRLVGNPQLVEGRFGNALQFDGISDAVEVPHDNSLTVSEAVTVMAWIHTPRHNHPHSNWQGILAKGDQHPRSYSFYTERGGTIHLALANSGSSTVLEVDGVPVSHHADNIPSEGMFQLNQWQHVAARIADGERQYWINGVKAGTTEVLTPFPGLGDTASVLIGSTHEGARNFQGLIDEVRIYNRGLSEAEILELMQVGYQEPPDMPEPMLLTEDINKDGVVDILDLDLVSANFLQVGENIADVNNDGTVNIVDLTLVAAAFGQTASAAPYMFASIPENISITKIEKWLREARSLNLPDAKFQRGILVLEQLLKMSAPKQTALLPNYPNPFNPETWIPYQLASPASVSVSIYASDGKLIRTLTLGHQVAGVYHVRSRAAYWDGKNAQGEAVASGVYFYTLTAGDFTATRRMLILK